MPSNNNSNQQNAFITGNSRGLGRGLSSVLLDRGYQVYGCSRKRCKLKDRIYSIDCDLQDFDKIPAKLQALLGKVNSLDLVFLNAGVLSPLQNMSDTSIEELREIMNINVWSNKIILDWFLQSGIEINQIVLMSSGAAVFGSKGWGGYAISKSALNMLGKLYAHEFNKTHIIAIAPGLIDTQIMDYLCNEADSTQFPALKRIQNGHQAGIIQSPEDAARKILDALPEFKTFASGDFIDLRQIIAPEEYQALIQSKQKN